MIINVNSFKHKIEESIVKSPAKVFSKLWSSKTFVEEEQFYDEP